MSEWQLRLMNDLEHRGWHVKPDVIGDSLLDSICNEFGPALELRQTIRQINQVDGNNDGTLHHLLGDHPCFLDLLARLEIFDPAFKQYFGGNYILNSYGGFINQHNNTAYVHNIHRDIRFFSDEKRFMLNILVMLDDFTLENGATHLLSASHRQSLKPEQEAFFASADRATGRRGSMLFFDSRLWHATGQNRTSKQRRALTLTFTSPFFKQQIDYPRLIGLGKAASLNPFLKQAIGYNSRVPTSLYEYYVPVAQRFYQRGQDD